VGEVLFSPSCTFVLLLQFASSLPPAGVRSAWGCTQFARVGGPVHAWV